jgi:protoheme IX farnesyltransferase
MLQTYYHLTKPGIIYGNGITTLAGFLLASRWHINWVLLPTVLLGSSLVIACGCVINNYIDRNIDKHMARTKERALVTGTISARAALIYAAALGVLGFWILAAYTNLLTVAVGLVGLIDYVVLYGYFKRRSVHGTLVGSIAGATPILAGYTAVTNRLDITAVLLFLIMAVWQIPHFYAIAVYRLKDYTRAGIPVWPAEKGINSTKLQIALYIILFTVLVITPTLAGSIGYSYLVVVLGVSLWWFRLALQGFKAKDSGRWARKLFGTSLVVVLVFSAMLATSSLLP